MFKTKTSCYFDFVTKKWTTALCNADSDSDNKTNGVELGDPHCSWTEGLTLNDHPFKGATQYHHPFSRTQ